METLSVVADAGPLIALAKANLIGLLDQIFDNTHIPDAVRSEVLAKQGRESRRIREALSTFISTSSPATPPHQVTIVTRHLDLGEAEAIALAYERQALLFIDDALGRKAAQRLGLPVVGTIGVVLRAKQLRLVDGVMPILNGMHRSGYWFSTALLAQAAVLAEQTEHNDLSNTT